jgi:hypothetical protein
MVFTRIVGVATGLALVLGAVSSVGVGAQTPPAGRLFGSVTVDSSSAADGTVIVAHVNSSTCGQGTFDANKAVYYVDLDSSQDDCSTVGNTVWFSVGPCTSYTTGTVPEFSGAEEVDLVAPGSC